VAQRTGRFRPRPPVGEQPQRARQLAAIGGEFEELTVKVDLGTEPASKAN